jgi:hypothetical protein
MLFAHLKRILKLDRLRLRGPTGAQDEFTLAAAAQNLRKLAMLLFRPPIAAQAARRASRSPRTEKAGNLSAPNGQSNIELFNKFTKNGH